MNELLDVYGSQDEKPKNGDTEKKKKESSSPLHRFVNRVVRFGLAGVSAISGVYNAHQLHENAADQAALNEAQAASEAVLVHHEEASEQLEVLQNTNAYLDILQLNNDIWYTSSLEYLKSILTIQMEYGQSNQTIYESLLNIHRISIQNPFSDTFTRPPEVLLDLSQNPEAAAQLDMLKEIFAIVDSYNGTDATQMSQEDVDRINEILNSDFSALGAALEQQIQRNEVEVLADFNALLIAYPELGLIRAASDSASTELSSALGVSLTEFNEETRFFDPNDTSVTNIFNALNSSVLTLNRLAPPASTAGHEEISNWAQQFSNSILSGLASNPNIQGHFSEIHSLTALAQRELTTGKFAAAGALALSILCFIASVRVNVAALVYDQWNRLRRKQFNSIADKEITTLENALKGHLEPGKNLTAEIKEKILAALAELSTIKDTLKKLRARKYLTSKENAAADEPDISRVASNEDIADSDFDIFFDGEVTLEDKR